MKKIFEEMKKLDGIHIESGFPEGSGTVKQDKKEVDIATYASYNENGTYNKDGSQHLPARPFMSQAVDNNEEHIIQTVKKLIGLVIDGKIDAITAVRRQAEDMNALIKDTIRNGDFAPNSDVTIHGLGASGSARQKGERWLRTKSGRKLIKGKKSTKPLIDTSTMRNSVQSVIVENGAKTERVKTAKLH
jgi:hypothetical protein